LPSHVNGRDTRVRKQHASLSEDEDEHSKKHVGIREHIIAEVEDEGLHPVRGSNGEESVSVGKEVGGGRVRLLG